MGNGRVEPRNGLDPLAGPSKEALLSFAPGMPDLSLFPRRQWLQCYHDAVEYASIDDLGYNRPSGRWDLRVAIARYLHEVKGIVAGPERIVVTAGSSQAFAILASLFPRARVLMENPQAPFVRRIFDGLGCRYTYAGRRRGGIVPKRGRTSRWTFCTVTPGAIIFPHV
jgi:GntR family transcriptional regulator/MocR family aminotransferase